MQTQLELAAMMDLGEPKEIASAQGIAQEELRILNASLSTLRAKLAEGKKK